MNNYTDSHKTQLAATCILLSIADADEVIEDKELVIIHEILYEFFSLEQNAVQSLMDEAAKIRQDSTDLFQFGAQLNKDFTHDDKIDFINCVFEVAYADGNLHYLEQHTVKKIANILNLHRDDIIAAKAEIESYLD
ncbi:uncharacterized protein METZ01_LOCUS273442 [marine metagenome]|uniref:Co-chaperone DjlA N-terminal domain-containing protein n=1 Tax=marine metagenome TaxID=408172 RepID=A0A382K8C8_9ZZZZ